MTDDRLSADIKGTEDTSCAPSLNRKQFIQKIVKGAALTGAVMAAPKVLDKFILPAVAAGLSSCNANDTQNPLTDIDTNGGTDIQSNAGADTFCGG
jgi:hypothetical protein